MLQGVTSFHDDATPICALSQSSSVMPMARSMARAGARSMPSVTSRERCLMSTGVVEMKDRILARLHASKGHGQVRVSF